MVLPVRGWGLNQRAYMDTAMNGFPLTNGITLAAAIIPTLLTAISSSCSSGAVGRICLKHSTLTRSDSFTTMGQRS